MKEMFAQPESLMCEELGDDRRLENEGLPLYIRGPAGSGLKNEVCWQSQL